MSQRVDSSGEFNEERISRSVLVSALPPFADRPSIIIHFQSRKNGGGDVEDVVVLRDATVIVTFDDERVARSVLALKQTMDGVLLNVQRYRPQRDKEQYQVFSKVSAKVDPRLTSQLTAHDTRVLINKVKGEANVECVEGTFIITGTYQQIARSQRCLFDYFFQTPLDDYSHEDRVSHKQEKQNGSLHKPDIHSLLPKTSEELTVNLQEKKKSDKSFLVNSESLQNRKGNPAKISRVMPDTPVSGGLSPKIDYEDVSMKTSFKAESLKVSQKRRISPDHSKQSTKKEEKRKIPSKMGRAVERDESPDVLADAFKMAITEKEWYVFVEAYQKELEILKGKLKVEIEPLENNATVIVKPLRECSAKELRLAAETLTGLYDTASKNMTCVWFTLADQHDQLNQQKLRKTVIEIKKTFPVHLERTADRKSWEVFGESETVQKVLNLLEREVKLLRKTPDTEDEQETEDTKLSSEDDSITGDSREEAAHANGLDNDNEEDDEDDDIDDDIDEKLKHNLGQITLSVYRGEITDETCDAIVNAANQSLSHGAGVVKAIVAKGGSLIKDESRRIVRQDGKLNPGEAAVTPSGDLRCKMVVHAVGPNWRHDNGQRGKTILKKACTESLRQAAKFGCKSIAFPAISSGIYGMPKNLCAQVMFDMAEEYNTKKKVSSPSLFTVTDIRFVNNDKHTVNVFRREFKTRYGTPRHTAAQAEPKATSLTANDLTANGFSSPTWQRELDTTKPSRSVEHPDKASDVNTLTGITHSMSHYQQLNSRDQSSKLKRPTNAGEAPQSFGGARPKISQHQVLKQTNQKTSRQSVLVRSKSLRDNRFAECSICFRQPMEKPQTLECKHTFCETCLEKALKTSPMCPYCRAPQASRRASCQPLGTMKSRAEQFGLPGYDQHCTIVIEYTLRGGIQGPQHPNPSQRYDGTCRTAYLPDNHEGREVYKLLRIAFHLGIVFTIGKSLTSGLENQIIWGDIPHKTCINGGPDSYGYPDRWYLSETKRLLCAMIANYNKQ